MIWTSQTDGRTDERADDLRGKIYLFISLGEAACSRHCNRRECVRCYAVDIDFSRQAKAVVHNWLYHTGDADLCPGRVRNIRHTGLHHSTACLPRCPVAAHIFRSVVRRGDSLRRRLLQLDVAGRIIKERSQVKKHAIKLLKTSPARLAQLLQPSIAFCFNLQPMTAHRPVRRHWLQAKTKC